MEVPLRYISSEGFQASRTQQLLCVHFACKCLGRKGGGKRWVGSTKGRMSICKPGPTHEVLILIPLRTRHTVVAPLNPSGYWLASTVKQHLYRPCVERVCRIQLQKSKIFHLTHCLWAVILWIDQEFTCDHKKCFSPETRHCTMNDWKREPGGHITAATPVGGNMFFTNFSFAVGHITIYNF